MNCIVADDEPLARKGLEQFISEVPFLSLQGLCSNGAEVIQIMSEKKADLLFLDIQMPKMTGISLLKTLPDPPLVIITSAYPNYALEAYELSVLDYLVKPFSFERFIMAVNKARQQHDLLNAANQALLTDSNAHFFVKTDKNYVKIFFDEILYIEALQNYSIIHTAQSKYTVYLTLKGIENQLPSGSFLKINRSYIVNINKVSSVNGNEVILGTVSLQIGRSFKDQVMQQLLGGRLLKR